MIELLLTLIAGLVGGLLSRYIPALPWRRKQTKALEVGIPGKGEYEITLKGVRLYQGSDLHSAKQIRHDHPGSVLIADGVNRG